MNILKSCAFAAAAFVALAASPASAAPTAVDRLTIATGPSDVVSARMDRGRHLGWRRGHHYGWRNKARGRRR